jgi:Transposase
VVESDDKDHVNLGSARASLTHGPTWPEGVQEATSDSGDFVLRYRVWDHSIVGRNRLRVTFLELTMLQSDGDAFGEGELRMRAGANEELGTLSTWRKSGTGDTLPLSGAAWMLEPRVNRDQALNVTFDLYEQDSDALTVLDRLDTFYDLADTWGLGEHVVDSAAGRFRVRYLVEPADDDGLPDLPGLVPLEVEFIEAVLIDDGDGISRGEVTFTGEAKFATVFVSPEYSVKADEPVALGGPLAPRTAWVQPDQGLLVSLTADERDGNVSSQRNGLSRRRDNPFHVVRLAGDALDRCRRRVQQRMHGHRGRKDDPLYRTRRTLHTGAGLLTDTQADRLTTLFADDRHVEVEATWGIYQQMIAAYRDPDRAKGREVMTKLIESVSRGVPKTLSEVITLGRTLKKRAADVLAYFDRPGTSNGPTEAINGRLEHLRGSALGFRNLTNYIARSLLETGGFRPRLHPRI